MSDHHHSTQTRRRPSALARFFWICCGVFAVFTLLGASAVAYAAFAYHTMPAIVVSVDDHTGESPDISFRIPAALVGAGLKLVPHVVPAEEWEEARRDIEAELSQIPAESRAAAGDLIRQVRDMPDAVIVEVVDGGEQVTVAKRGGDIEISIRSQEADVDVTVPVALLEQVAEFVQL